MVKKKIILYNSACPRNTASESPFTEQSTMCTTGIQHMREFMDERVQPSKSRSQRGRPWHWTSRQSWI